MTVKKLLTNRYIRDTLLMLLFGLLSYLLGEVKFYLPGIEGMATDLREIPLLISIFHLSNPLFTIGVSALSSLGTPPDGSYISTFTAHSIALLISFGFYNYLKKFKFSITLTGVLSFFYIIIYYLVMVIPLLILLYHITGINSSKEFINYYRELTSGARFEIVSTALIVSLYLIQDQVRFKLKNHKENLELIVKDRTEELETLNEELKSTNEELSAKGRIINNQNFELQSSLKHLKDTQFQLIQFEKMASLGVMTSGVAHEINNPLNYIMGGYVGLKNYFKQNEPTDKNNISVFMEGIETGVERAAAIVTGLNQFSRSNDNYNEDCDIRAILNNCLFILKTKQKEGIDIIKNFTSEEINVKGNVGQLHQVFINIILNSIQAIREKGTISISTRKEESTLITEITDTGCGISKKNLSKITDPFFTTKDPGKGTGLGLSIVYTIIQEHNGELFIESTINKGTSVKIKLPVKKNVG